MSQYSSRIYIKVNDVKQWELLQNIDFSNYGINVDFEKECKGGELVIDADWSVSENELSSLVYRIVSSLSYNCIVLADTTNINVGANEFIAYYIGSSDVKEKSFDENSRKADMFYQTKITDVVGWLKYSGVRIYDKEEKHLQCFGYELEKKEQTKKKKQDNAVTASANNKKYISKIAILVSDTKNWKSVRKDFLVRMDFKNVLT